MSNPDSFINEVTEELRRDKMVAALRRYGWLVALVVVAIVGGAAWNEWSKSSARASAEAFGDAVLAAFDAPDDAARLAALQSVSASGAQAGLLGLMQAGALLETDRAAALAVLDRVSTDSALPDAWRQLAALKRVKAGGADLPVQERRTILMALAQPGQPLRPLATEALGLLALEQGDVAEARSVFDDLLTQAEATDILRRRVSQILAALGPADD